MQRGVVLQSTSNNDRCSCVLGRGRERSKAGDQEDSPGLDGKHFSAALITQAGSFGSLRESTLWTLHLRNYVLGVWNNMAIHCS
jgi:hypothetical protein